MAKWNWQGPVYATPASVDITGLILRDSAHLQEQDAEKINRRRKREGKDPVKPIYTLTDADHVIRLLKPVPYHEPVQITSDIRAQFVEAGHILGSASIQIIVTENGSEKKVIFSGDLGPRGIPILRDFEPFHQADAVFLESTYGDRDHKPFGETVAEFHDILQDSIDRKGKIFIPTFAIGRAQMLIALLAWMFRNHRLAPVPVFLDSPMAIEASVTYLKHRELFDDEAIEYMKQKPLEEDLRTFTSTLTAEESKSINGKKGPLLVMAGSGMCNGGRILHHLRNNLWDPDAHVIIVGYQSAGTLGRQLVEGKKMVKIYGEPIAVKAQIHTLGGFSAHAGQSDLLAWFEPLAAAKPRVMIIHGEDKPRQALADCIRKKFSINSELPGAGDIIEL